MLQEEKFSPLLRISLRIWIKTCRSAITLIKPFFDLLLRFLIAQAIFRSGAIKLADWDTALNLARFEYPVSWMSPETAALIGIIIEVLAPILLFFGLFTRMAAMSIMALLIISQIEYIPTDLNLWLIALLGFYVLRGPEAISLDAKLGSGLADSALPFARVTLRFCDFMKAKGTHLWLLICRLWITIALCSSAGLISLPNRNLYMPMDTFQGIPAMLAIPFGILLILGLFAPIVATMLVIVVSSLGVMGLHPDLTLYPYLLFAYLGIFGFGALSFDNGVSKWFEANIMFDRKYSDIPDRWPHIVVVGAGFGGLACVNKLKKLPVRISLIDRHNYHLFQPLLYQIATAALSPADIATPIRGMFRNDGNVRVILGDVTSIDTDSQTLFYDDGSLQYDSLVLATGATHSYFGNDQWSDFAPGLKTVEDGVSIRAQVLNAFEKAESALNPDDVKRLLTFVVVGAGPTGVELAGAIAELARHGLKDEFSEMDPTSARVILVQAGDRVLPAFPEELSHHAAGALEKLGVEIKLNARVTDILSDHVNIADGEQIMTETVLWAAGVVASPAGKWLNAEMDRSGRVFVDDKLRVKDFNNVFAIGDTAASNGWDGQPVPGLAPAAKQSGQYVASYIQKQLLESKDIKPFAYKHQGSLATIGRKSAVADFGAFKLHGAPAWWLWGVVHVGFLSGFRNRISVIVNWVWSYFTMRQGIRLITGLKKRS